MMTRYFIYIFFLLVFQHCRPEIRNNTIKVGLSHGKSHSFSQALALFKEQLEERSGGRLEVQIFHSSQIGSEKEMQEMLTLGSLDICISGVLNTYEPLFTLFEMPYLYRNREHVIRVNYGPVMQDAAAGLGAEGIVLIGFYENGFRNISTTGREINEPSDLEGLKI
ncbi:MAG: TRAP transporter substrate-binding protein, partial [Cyclobacteriaceae bacterium]|nr:TRAP transporter substrate-binding protein [Cyclobacteriaceae bacterium]